jgi:hypothetical protein
MAEQFVPVEAPIDDEVRSNCIRYFISKNSNEVLKYSSPRELVDFLQRSPGAAGWTMLNKTTGDRRVVLMNPHFKWTFREYWRSPGGWLDEIPEDIAWLE